VRLLFAAGGGVAAMLWLEAGPEGIFAAIALGFAAYAGLTGVAAWRSGSRTA